MTRFGKTIAIFLVALAFAAPSSAIAGGKHGFSLTADLHGLFHPVIERAIVTSVTAGSPAARAGLEVGDDIIDVNGRPLQGASAHELLVFKNRKSSDPLQLKVKRGNEIVLVHIASGAQTPGDSSRKVRKNHAT